MNGVREETTNHSRLVFLPFTSAVYHMPRLGEVKHTHTHSDTVWLLTLYSCPRRANPALITVDGHNNPKD